jgi:hypothetical protein
MFVPDALVQYQQNITENTSTKKCFDDAAYESSHRAMERITYDTSYVETYDRRTVVQLALVDVFRSDPSHCVVAEDFSSGPDADPPIVALQTYI